MKESKQPTVSASNESEHQSSKGKSMPPPLFSLSASDPDDLNMGQHPNAQNDSAKTETPNEEGGPILLGDARNQDVGAGSKVNGLPFQQNYNLEGLFMVGPPKVQHFTSESAPDGSNGDRKKVGVGEEVVFYSDVAGIWTANTGTPAKQLDGKKFVWKAPKRAATATITIKSGQWQTSVSLDVLEPQTVTTEKFGDFAFDPGAAGAGMYLHFDYNPTTVSFANLEAGEISGPASGIEGYFKRWPAETWAHDSGDSWTPIDRKNRLMGHDEAAGSGFARPWSEGKFDWIIPNRFRVEGESGDGKVFHNMTQSFSIAADGTVTVTKGGSSVTRTP